MNHLLLYINSLDSISFIQWTFELFLSPEHSMADTFNVALRVAEEAIDEAIAKAETQADSQVRLSH